MRKSKLEIRKRDLLPLFEGYKKADELIKAEKMKRLSELTRCESLREYDNLCNLWEINPHKEGIEVLDRRRLFFLIERRRRFNKIGGLGEE